MKRFVVVLFGALAFYLPSLVDAETSESARAARDVLDHTIQSIRTTVTAERGKSPDQELHQKLEQILHPIFDFQEMSRSSLGVNWSGATPSEQKEFVTLFTELLAKSYLKKIRENIEASRITFLEPVTRDTSVVVKTTVLSKGDEFPIDYRMRLTNGAWRVYDVVIENIGLVSNYRNEFTPIVRREKMTGLLAKLREKVAASRVVGTPVALR